jgi:basic membrane lipoprotein Med (substrate-binding protein (PBP1-ABC) superfamily)
VIMQNVDAASSGVFEAVKEHNARMKIIPIDINNPPIWVYTFGANSDQNGNMAASDYTLASAVIKLDRAFGEFAKSVKGGTFKGGLVKEDLASGVSVMVMNPKLVGNVIDNATVKLVEEAGKKLSAGEIKIPTQ